MDTILYGIPNCDTVKKSQKWLAEHNIPYAFHNYRKDGLDRAMIESFLENIQWEILLNKRSSSYRQLTEQQKNGLNRDTIVPLFIEFPTLIKRPLLIHHSTYLLGFSVETYQTLFSL
jgi:Spx/MgsR family transcriptional regulator